MWSTGAHPCSFWFFRFSLLCDDLVKVTGCAQIFAWQTIYIICHMKVMRRSLKRSLADSDCIPQSACTWTTSIHIRVFLSQHTLSKLLWSLILLTLQCSRILSPNPLFPPLCPMCGFDFFLFSIPFSSSLFLSFLFYKPLSRLHIPEFILALVLPYNAFPVLED